MTTEPLEPLDEGPEQDVDERYPDEMTDEDEGSAEVPNPNPDDPDPVIPPLRQEP